jgi:hypothetical protein
MIEVRFIGSATQSSAKSSVITVRHHAYAHRALSYQQVRVQSFTARTCLI